MKEHRRSLSLLPSHLLRARLHGLYVITHELGAEFGSDGHRVIARAALAGGAAILQLRDKASSTPQLLETARELRRWTRTANTLFIINDRVDVALAINADGVHLGPDDMPLTDARRVLGPHRLLGASCGSVAEALQAERAGADYIGAGAVFGTTTKSDAGTAIGLDALRAIVAATNLPVAAIGGIHRDNIVATMATGAAMACAISAIANAGANIGANAGDEAAMIAATRELVDLIASCEPA